MNIITFPGRRRLYGSTIVLLVLPVLTGILPVSRVRGVMNTAPMQTAQAGNGQAGNGQAAAADPWGSLSLTADQKQRIKTIRDQVKFEQQAANERVQSAQKGLDDAIYSENPDEALVDQRARELSDARADALKVRARTELSIRRLLTPEQLTTFKELRRKAAEQRNADAKAKANELRAQRQQRNLENRLKNKQKAPIRKEGSTGGAPTSSTPERRRALPNV